MITVGYGKNNNLRFMLKLLYYYIKFFFYYYFIGDTYPVTFYEKTLVIVLTIISCGVFAYAVNTIDIIVRDI